jgi:dihydroxyacetone kinase-like predicted kinase
MSVQHSERSKHLLKNDQERDGAFALVAVAPSECLGNRFLAMGVDVVLSFAEETPPSTQDFLEAIAATGKSEVLVFPNHKNLMLAAEQAKSLSETAQVTVADATSIAHCYAALAMLDFEAERAEDALETVSETLANVSTVRIAYASKEAVYGEIRIQPGDAVAMTGNSVLAAGESISALACRVIDLVMTEKECDTVTMFTGVGMTETDVAEIADYIGTSYLYTETDLVETGVKAFELLLSFE